MRVSFARFARTCNESAPIFRLPTEVLGHIFVRLAWHERFDAASVSTSWASILYNAPTLWNYVDMHDDAAWADNPHAVPGSLTSVLALSAAADLTWVVRVTTANGEEVVRELQRHLARCVNLELWFLDAVPIAITAALLAALRWPAPRLLRFVFGDPVNLLWSPVPDPLPLFGGQAPRLQSVKLLCKTTAPVLATSSFPSVTQLVLQLTDGISFAGLRHVLSRFRHVRHLSIDSAGDVPSLDLTWTRLIPSTLEDLVLFPDSKEDLEDVIRTLQRDRIVRLWIWYAYDEEPEEALSLLQCLSDTARVSNLRIDHKFQDRDGTEDVNVYMWDCEDAGAAEARPVHSMLNAPVGLWQQLDDALLSRLTHLSVDETLLGQHDAFPALPQLEVLTVGILPPQEQNHADLSIFLLPRTARTVLHFPALRMLKLAVTRLPYDEGATRLAPEVVREFVECRLRYVALRLETLVLRGVFLLENVPAEVAALLGLFDALRVEGHRVWVVAVEPVGDMWH